MYGSEAKPNQTSILDAMGPAPSAWDLAAKYTAKWPAAREAAETAAAYIDKCRVYRNTTLTTAGDDAWIVDDHHCSHTGRGLCDCKERAVIDAQYGRLCSHRIAVMMYKSLVKANGARLIALIKHFDDNAGADENRRMILYLDRYYGPAACEDAKFIRYAGRGGQMLRTDAYDQFPIDNAAMIAAARLTGYVMEMAPRKEKHMRYTYVLTPVDAANPPTDDRIWLSHDATYFEAQEDRRARERKLARQLAEELHRNARQAATEELEGEYR